MNSILEPVDALLTSQTGTIADLRTQVAEQNGEIQTLNGLVTALQRTVWFNGLEQQPAKLVAGSLADSNIVSGNVPYSEQKTPGAWGCASRMIDPKGQQYANAMWYWPQGAHPELSIFEYYLSFLAPTFADAAASQCVESDLQQVINGVVHNWGWQFQFSGGLFRIWDRNAHTLDPTKGWNTAKAPDGTPIKITRWTPGQWVRVRYEVHRDLAADTITYDAVTINGVRTVLQVSYPLPNLNLKEDTLNPAVQLNGNYTGAAYKILLDDVRLKAS